MKNLIEAIRQEIKKLKEIEKAPLREINKKLECKCKDTMMDKPSFDQPITIKGVCKPECCTPGATVC